MNTLTRAVILNEVLERLGSARALEAAETHETPEPNKYGCVGVDFTGGKYRARIRFCNALTGQDIRITLLRSESLTEADYAYRAAHVALWGSASWAACDDIMRSLRTVKCTTCNGSGRVPAVVRGLTCNCPDCRGQTECEGCYESPCICLPDDCNCDPE